MPAECCSVSLKGEIPGQIPQLKSSGERFLNFLKPNYLIQLKGSFFTSFNLFEL